MAKEEKLTVMIPGFMEVFDLRQIIYFPSQFSPRLNRVDNLYSRVNLIIWKKHIEWGLNVGK